MTLDIRTDADRLTSVLFRSEYPSSQWRWGPRQSHRVRRGSDLAFWPLCDST